MHRRCSVAADPPRARTDKTFSRPAANAAAKGRSTGCRDEAQLLSLGQASGSGRRSYNGAGRDASKPVFAAIFGCQRIAVGAGRAASDLAVTAAGLASGRLPRPVVRHWAFDGEHTAIVVGDDEVERLAVRVVSGHEEF